MTEKNNRILVVDDLSDWRTTLSGLLTDVGYEVQTAESFDKAMEQLDKNSFDLAILDLRLVDSDVENEGGLKLAEEIKKSWARTRIIIITAYGTPDRMRRAMEPDLATHQPLVDDYLSKNDMDKLVPTVQKILAHSKS